MPTQRKQFTVYPEPTARKLVAWSAGAANNALARYAELLDKAEVAGLERADWNYLADCLNGMSVGSMWRPAFLGAEIADADRLSGLGVKWFGDQRAAQRVERLIAVIESLDQVALWAVITAVEWFWDHHDEVDAAADEWWTSAFRARHSGGGAEED